MILNEGIMVRMGGDNTALLKSLAQGKAGVAAFGGAAVTALAAITAKSVQMAAQLDKDLRLVQTLGGEAARSVGALRSEVGALSREFGRSMNELVRANYQAVSGGFKDITKSMEVTRAGTKLAIAGNADLVGSTEGVVKWLKAFSNESLTADDAAAQLWGTTRDGIVTVEQLNRFLADLPATMGQSGIKSYELVAALSTLTGVTGNAGRAVDQLRSLVIKMEQEGFSGTLLQRIERFNEKGLGELVTLLGDQTAATGAQVLAANMGTLAENVDNAQVVAKDFNAAVDLMNSGPMAEWQKATAALTEEWTRFGEALLPVATVLANIANQNMRGFFGGLTGTWRIPEAMGTVGTRGSYGGWGPEPLPADVSYSLPGSYYTPMAEGGMPIARDPFATIGSRTQAFRDALLNGRPEFTERKANQFTTKDFQGGLASDDYIAGITQFGEAAEESSALAATSASILSSSIGGLLVSAFVTAESASGRFVQGLLAQFAQLAVQKGVGMLFGLPGFATGGFTGSTGGMVHPGEFVFNADAVRALGVGSLERQHRVAQAGGAEITINQTINGGNPSDVAGVTKAGVMSAIREADATGQSRLYQSSAARWGR